jgi:Fe2+ or Zn2+ uptake regulation protein
MSDFEKAAIEAARLKMLELLAQTAGYSANNEIIQTALAAMGLRLSAASVRAELGFLEDCATVKLVDVGHLVVAELTERGLDVSKGLSSMRGIARPVPGSGL